MLPRYVKRLEDGTPLFERAVPYADFIAGYEGARGERFRKSYAALEITDADAAWFRQRAASAGGSLRVLVVNENWCGDGLEAMAVLAKLAEITGVVDPRVLYRDAPENEAVVEGYFLTTGKKKIPVFVFLDQAGRELGRFASRVQEQEEAHAAGDVDFVREYYATGRHRRPLLEELKQAASGEEE